MYCFTRRVLGFILFIFIVFESFVGNSIVVHADFSDNHSVISEPDDTSPESQSEDKHTYTYAITKEPTCSEAGIVIFTNVDGDTYSEEIPMLQHIPDNWEVTKEATFKHPGEKIKRCAFCGEVMETAIIPQKTIPCDLITTIISVFALLATASVLYTTQIKKALA